MHKKKVFYWCPVISNVATINATINSINSIYLDEPVKLNTQGMKRP